MDIKAECDTSFQAVHDSGTRPMSAIKHICLHSEEADTAESAAAWFANPKSQGSAHICVDDDICYRTLGNDKIPWAAPGLNMTGFHIEQAGFARWGSIAWLRHRRTIKRAAYKAATHAKRFDIPLVWVDANGLKAGKPGFTTHAEVTKAFGGTHTDPGVFYPKRYFMRQCKRFFDEL